MSKGRSHGISSLFADFATGPFINWTGTFWRRKDPVARIPMENIGQPKKQRTCTNWPRMRLQNKSYFLASQVSSLMEENKTLHSFCKALSAMTGIYFDPLNLPDRTFSFDDSRPVTVPAPTPATPEAPQSAPTREETCECCDYGVKPGDFNKGHDMSFILSERARKRRRDVLMAYTTEEMPKEVSGASSESSEISAGQAKTKNKRRRKGRRTKKTGC
ncbi:hypothetical protein QYM36_014886 [Artemia franciscana]|uniref:Uncharacterized protein n=1 Tax=Artemia franciscana TaxID=6661 RepID=A0AA88HB13_ARTSF|nr:hypothetical protein QYM36_014886 [Artemia franciscana]